MAARAWKGMLLGYKGTNQYRIWDPINSKVHIRHDIVFNEAKSPHWDSLLTEAVGASDGFGIDVTDLILTEISLEKGNYDSTIQNFGSDDELDESDQEDNEASVGQDEHGSYTIDIDGSRIYDSIRVGPPAPQFSTTPPPSPSKRSGLRDLPRRTYGKQVVEGFARAAKAELRNDTPTTYKDANRSSSSRRNGLIS
ncbi:MAG: hypothetical protein FRX48_03918 [Lasallia pustulata]|uniref:Retroviral polymerase SH3-like domain-containing protein n=1 Tax=Lasallia pustulata TaxID=136370 RepID=A0A5M8PVB8_9LECA|nr:MAG: hypothetical protein FRX48_03918 [Lasallia pustulata]